MTSLDVPLPLDGWKVKVLSLLQRGRNMFVGNSNAIGSFEVFSSHFAEVQRVNNFLIFLNINRTSCTRNCKDGNSTFEEFVMARLQIIYPSQIYRRPCCLDNFNVYPPL
jgi:hypothetical protein